MRQEILQSRPPVCLGKFHKTLVSVFTLPGLCEFYQVHVLRIAL